MFDFLKDYKKEFVIILIIDFLSLGLIMYFLGVDEGKCYGGLIIVFLLTEIVILFLSYLLELKNRFIIIFTMCIMAMGIFAQSLTFSTGTPVRLTLSELYDFSISDELLEEYRDDRQISSEISSMVSRYKERYMLNEKDVKEAFNEFQEYMRCDIPRMILTEKAEYVKKTSKISDDEQSRLEEVSKGTSEETSKEVKEEVSEEEMEETSGDAAEKTTSEASKVDDILKYAKQYKAKDNINRINLFECMDIDFAEKADIFFRERCTKIPGYADMVHDNIMAKREEHARNLMRGLSIGMFAALLMMLFVMIIGIHYDWFILIMALLQILLMVAAKIFGKGDGASLILFGVNILEFTKISYIIVMTGLVGMKEKDYILHPRFNRILFMLLYNLATMILFLLCSELGTMLILCAVSVVLCMIVTEKREWNVFFQSKIHCGIVIVGVCLMAGIFIFILGMGINYSSESESIDVKYDVVEVNEETGEIEFKEDAIVEKHCIFEFSATSEQWSKKLREISGISEDLKIEDMNWFEKLKYSLNSSFMKICQRFYALGHYDVDNEDKFVNKGSGSQYFEIAKARKTGGWLGQKNEKDKIYISENETDAVFAQMVHFSGAIMGIFLIGLYICLITVSYKHILKIENRYYKTVGMSIVLLLAVQNLLHIIINLSWFPIAGVSLMYISKGGAIQTVSLIMTFMLVAVSANKLQVNESVKEHIKQSCQDSMSKFLLIVITMILFGVIYFVL